MLRPAPAIAAVSAAIAALSLLGACLLDGDGGFGPDDVLQPPPKTTAGGASSSGGAGGAGASGGMGGTGGIPANCGNGVIDDGEECDDNNALSNDGCAACTVEEGYDCSGEPSVCTQVAAQVISVGPNLNLPINDSPGFYNGTTSTMTCTTLVMPDNGHPSTQSVELAVGVTHSYVGDLVIKLVSPMNTISTMVSRPGYAEPADTYDPNNGDSSNISASSPITFRDGENDNAENMGNGLQQNSAVCADDGRCAYRPDAGATMSNGMAEFDGENPAGNWRVCVADGSTGSTGSLQSATLAVLSW